MSAEAKGSCGTAGGNQGRSCCAASQQSWCQRVTLALRLVMDFVLEAVTPMGSQLHPETAVQLLLWQLLVLLLPSCCRGVVSLSHAWVSGFSPSLSSWRLDLKISAQRASDPCGSCPQPHTQDSVGIWRDTVLWKLSCCKWAFQMRKKMLE